MYDFTVLPPIPRDKIEEILAMPEWAKAQPAKIMGGRRMAGRDSSIAWAPFESPVMAMMERIAVIANKAFLLPDFKADVESVQLTTYEQGQGYVWHTDRGSQMHSFHARRRLSITIQLSEPADYVDGTLQLNFGYGEIMDMIKNQGAVVVFPSYVLHQVTPVTRGTRRSLVSWVR